MARTVKAIETRYKGYRFRSRLEARWAIAFDAMGLAWGYEPECYDTVSDGWYTPDFFVRTPSDSYPDGGYWVEVKGVRPTAEQYRKLLSVTRHTGHNGAFLYGCLNNPRYMGCCSGELTPDSMDFSAVFAAPFHTIEPDIVDRAITRARAFRFDRR